MELNKIYNEPCLDTLGKMPNSFLDCVITSPPYWQLRDYGYDGQWGIEPSFQEYLSHLWQMMDEIYRVIKPSGTVWINLGDCYTGSGNGSWAAPPEQRGKQKRRIQENNETAKYLGQGTAKGFTGLPNKCLLLLPHRFAIGCIDRGWIMRNDCIWAKRNAMPESVTDRFSKKHEYFFFMVKSDRYYFDLDAIRDNPKTESLKRYQYDFSENKIGIPERKFNYTNHTQTGGKDTVNLGTTHEKCKNPGSVSDFWDITTKGSSEKHYASYNDSLLVKPVLAGCPKGGIIYDPFIGTGSTGEVALRSERKYIGSEMSKEYCDIAEKRLLPFKQQGILDFK